MAFSGSGGLAIGRFNSEGLRGGLGRPHCLLSRASAGCSSTLARVWQPGYWFFPGNGLIPRNPCSK